jgi:hypothetical protein
MADPKVKYPYTGRGDQRIAWFRSKTFNIDNGSGTTDDDIILSDLDKAAYVVHVRAVYVEATDTAGAASATFGLGTAVGGVTVVAATALEVSKAVGSATIATVVAGLVPAGGALFARHTGIAATDAGQYYLQVGVLLQP